MAWRQSEGAREAQRASCNETARQEERPTSRWRAAGGGAAITDDDFFTAARARGCATRRP